MRRWFRFHLLLWGIGAMAGDAALTAATATMSYAQPAADVIRGRVTGPDGQPIMNAQVTAVSFNGGITKTKRTDKNGRFTITYANGEGDYWLSFAAIGFQAQRFEVKRNADEEVLIADIKLSNTQALGTVTVTANGPRQTPDRTSFGSADVSGGDKYLNTTGLPPDQQGNLAAMAANTPGVQLIPGVDGNPDRFSINGLDGSQNNASLNGQQSGLSSIPRDATVSTQLRGGYDVANGGFSGAQVSVTTAPGSNYISRATSGLFNAPQAQWNDRVGQASEYSFISLSGRASGPIVMDKDFYSTSFQFDHRSQNLATLLSSTPVVYQSAGISTDSVARLRTILGRLGIPLSAGGIGDNSTRTNASVLGGFDFAPKSAASGHAFSFVYNGAFSTNGPPGTAASQTPASLSESNSLNGGLQLRHTNFFGEGILTESMLSVSGSRNKNDPYFDSPGGTVLVTSLLDDGSATARSLSFGGSSTASTNTNSSLSGRNMLSRFSANNKHRLKLISELRVDRFASDRASNVLGRFTYQSLSDLENNRPSSFARSLNTVDQSGSQLVGALALGDAWRASNDVQVQYGVRLDGNDFFDKPANNPAVLSAFGVSNTHVPNKLYVSPRLGFSWTYGKASQLPFQDGFITAPRAVMRGGIGVFQNMHGPDLASGAISNTGLPGSAQQLNCTGDATPTVDWTRLASNGSFVPTQCLDGSEGTVFSSSAPNVTLFSKDFAQEKALRSNFSWQGSILDNRYTLNANLQYAFNFNQPDNLDLNFRPTQQFSLANEGNRPVYVFPTSIDPASGLIASRDARVSPLFNGVTELHSDLHSQSGQVQLTLSPFFFIAPKFRWNISYSYLNLQQQYRGFTSAAGSPLEIRSGTGMQGRHDIGYTLTYVLKNALTFTWNGRISSGARYTPTIAGDINGDGRIGNDRAFVFTPSSVSDNPAFASAMQGLLDHGSGSARDCLKSQLNQVAERNSCVSPWTAGNTTLRIAINASRIRLPQRTTLSFTISNPIGVADLALHGTDKLHGWGQTPFVDQSLYYVRGFDATKQQYTYEVNQRFGSTRAAQTTSRTPVVATMLLSVDLAPTRDWQNLSQSLDRGRGRVGTKMTEAAVRQYSQNVFTNPMQRLLQAGEQSHLTRMQADSLATMSRRFTRLVDSLWTPAAKYYAALPKEYDRTAAQARLAAARQVAVSYLITVAPGIKKMLTKGQYRVLPAGIANMLETRYLELMRTGQTGGDTFFFF